MKLKTQQPGELYPKLNDLQGIFSATKKGEKPGQNERNKIDGHEPGERSVIMALMKTLSVYFYVYVCINVCVCASKHVHRMYISGLLQVSRED